MPLLNASQGIGAPGTGYDQPPAYSFTPNEKIDLSNFQ